MLRRQLKTQKQQERRNNQLKPKQRKKGPFTMYEEIAKIFNIMAETGEYPREIKTVVLFNYNSPANQKDR